MIAKTKYALEKYAKPENVPYIRTPYGALVKGESVCEGYARALKAVLDKMGIERVLVQGTFVDGKFNRPHMWNYVRMDDNHWYLLDATMEDGMVGTSNAADDYFLKGSLDKGIDCYFPDGKVSMSELSFNFNYPDLSMAAYQPLTNAFSEDATTKFVSYQGMGLTKTREHGKYILCSYNGSTWYYAENLWKYNYVLMNSGNPAEVDKALRALFFL